MVVGITRQLGARECSWLTRARMWRVDRTRTRRSSLLQIGLDAVGLAHEERCMHFGGLHETLEHLHGGVELLCELCLLLILPGLAERAHARSKRGHLLLDVADGPAQICCEAAQFDRVDDSLGHDGVLPARRLRAAVGTSTRRDERGARMPAARVYASIIVIDASMLDGRMIICGARHEAESGKRFEVRNPATNELLTTVVDGGAEEARHAADAAAEALPEWRNRPAAERATLLSDLARRMRAESERLARLMTAEQGKPLAEARGEVAYAASFLEWSAAEGQRLLGEIIPANTAGKRLFVIPRPVGVTAAVTPWNFPLAMITRKLGPALAVGCTQVIKPAEQTPLSALALGAMAIEIGFPAGVVNVVTGDAPAIVAALFAHSELRKISFTGSTEVGRMLIRQAADRVVRLSLELGGHAPFIVFADADLDRAVAGAVASKFRNAGQTCICANRFLIHRSIHDEFVARFAATVSSLVVGPGDVEGVSVGPLIDDAAVSKVESHVVNARDGGARVITGGERAKPKDPRGRRLADRFFQPTILSGVEPGMLCTIEETFGPVAPVQTFDTEAEAIEMANGTPYGLAAYFYTRDIARLWRMAERLEFGVIGANDALPSTAQAPFGGVKQSGFGREGGHHGLRDYIDLHYLSLGL